MPEKLEQLFRDLMPNVDYCGFRYHNTQTHSIQVQQNVVLPIGNHTTAGVMVTIHNKGGIGYASTPNLSRSGLQTAIKQAQTWAETTSKSAVYDFSSIEMPAHVGEYRTLVKTRWNDLPLSEKIERLKSLSLALKPNEKIVDWSAAYYNIEDYRLYVTNHGGRIEQEFCTLIPRIYTAANEGSETISRSYSGSGSANQGGFEVIDGFDMEAVARDLASEALQLLDAPNCPTGNMNVLLAPDQMILQIHESIGHPLELDRILGDERNYAGTSFVTMDMFGEYQYGSDLLNITFDPTRPQELASYGFDDDGMRAEKTYLIEKGVLKTPLGGTISQARAGGIAGVANCRATSWNRPTMDRMANLNLEAGDSSLADMISSIERGVYMKSNSSWSIDDSRNKFQFGCEWGQEIKDGQLGGLVKKPNYRGISAGFWRNLRMTGDDTTVQVLGTPYCGKGEPNQAISVGHATPACVFSNVDVFGGNS